MLKKIGLTLALVTVAGVYAGAVPAFAQGDACVAPVAPAAIDGSTATLDQMKAAVAGVKAFIAASDTYQDCLLKDIAAKKAAATKDKPFDPAVEAAEAAKGMDNQALKQKVGDAYNAAAGAYKKAHAG